VRFGDDQYGVIDDINGKFLIETNHGAPTAKSCFTTGDAKLERRCAEKAEPLEGPRHRVASCL